MWKKLSLVLLAVVAFAPCSHAGEEMIIDNSAAAPAPVYRAAPPRVYYVPPPLPVVFYPAYAYYGPRFHGYGHHRFYGGRPYGHGHHRR